MLSDELEEIEGLNNEEDESNKKEHKTISIRFKNPRHPEVDLEEGTDEWDNHKQEYFDSLRELRSYLPNNYRIPIGRFVEGVVEAEKNDDYEVLLNIFDNMIEASEIEAGDSEVIDEVTDVSNSEYRQALLDVSELLDKGKEVNVENLMLLYSEHKE